MSRYHAAMPSTSIEWVLFDWGNVLVEYRPTGFPRLAELLDVPVPEVVDYMRESGVLRDLCTGALDPEAGLDRLAERFGKRIGRAEAVECFSSDVERILPGIEQLLADLQGVAKTAILSNTFFGHWDSFVGSDLYNRFELPMASHLLGGQKPDVAIYEAALKKMNARAGGVVFVDDKQENLDAAAALGMYTILSNCSVPTTRAGLVALLGRLG